MHTTASYSTASGSDRPLLRTIETVRELLGRVPLCVVELAMRIGVASIFFKSGLTKIASWESTVQLFAFEYQVPVLPPEIAAYLGTFNELVCSLMVAIGLFARLGAAALLGMTFVIQVFVYPDNWADHLLWASILAYVLTRGPGVLSLDHLIARTLFGGAR
jgi:putative oxidoreductase